MSNLNLQWLSKNFKDDSIIFNIGCADLTDDSLRFQMALPRSTIISFDCAEIWKEENINKSKNYNLPYFHTAVTDYDGTATMQVLDSTNTYWEYSGSLQNHVTDNNVSVTQVDCISLNTFCKEHNLIPDFVHVDVEGSEYNIFKNLNEQYWPIGAWIEYNDYYYDGDKSVAFSVLEQLFLDRGYIKIFHGDDILYVKKEFPITEYSIYEHYVVGGKIVKEITEFEKEIQTNIWLTRYELCRDTAWPVVTNVNQFYELPPDIKTECIQVFGLEPPIEIR